MEQSTILLLKDYAQQFETSSFLDDDPSLFMHQVQGTKNQEVTAFVASCLSYGSRQQFLPKIQFLIDSAQGNLYEWVVEGCYRELFEDGDRTFYRLYNCRKMMQFFNALREMLMCHGSMADYIASSVKPTMDGKREALPVLELLSNYFWNSRITSIVPRPHSSACKRPSMFLRWMVRDNSPVDLGLWSHLIDKQSLFIPLDTHVLNMARRLDIINVKSASWAAVVKLTDAMREVFPDDPVRADFALFGYETMGEKQSLKNK